MPISMEKLKPIIEPLMNEENSASLIEQLTAIDEAGPDVSALEAELASTKQALVDSNAAWNAKFKDMFFGTGTTPNDQSAQEQTADQAEEQEVTLTQFSELFTSN